MIDLNIFTNCTEQNSDSAALIERTFNSWKRVFSANTISALKVFIDPKPKSKNFHSYSSKIQTFFEKEGMQCSVFETNGLADGYLKSTKLCDSDYIFQLEHDWEFLPSIVHDIPLLIECMKKQQMEHLRFNKRENINLNESLTEIQVGDIAFCKTNKRSNNPHIIDRKSYLQRWNKRIDVSNRPKRADGIENMLVGVEGYIYGPFRYPKQINHIDGRGQKI